MSIFFPPRSSFPPRSQGRLNGMGKINAVTEHHRGRSRLMFSGPPHQPPCVPQAFLFWSCVFFFFFFSFRLFSFLFLLFSLCVRVRLRHLLSCLLCFRSGGHGYAVEDQAWGPDADHGGDEEGHDVSAVPQHPPAVPTCVAVPACLLRPEHITLPPVQGIIGCVCRYGPWS